MLIGGSAAALAALDGAGGRAHRQRVSADDESRRRRRAALAVGAGSDASVSAHGSMKTDWVARCRLFVQPSSALPAPRAPQRAERDGRRRFGAQRPRTEMKQPRARRTRALRDSASAQPPSGPTSTSAVGGRRLSSSWRRSARGPRRLDAHDDRDVPAGAASASSNGATGTDGGHDRAAALLGGGDGDASPAFDRGVATAVRVGHRRRARSTIGTIAPTPSIVASRTTVVHLIALEQADRRA